MSNLANAIHRSPLRWVGSKSSVADSLLSRIPEHGTYIEPFAGGASILFAKSPSKHEVLNDCNNDIINFWTVVRDHHEEFIESFRYTPASRKLFFDYKEKYLKKDYKDNIEWAHIFFYLNRTCFSGNMCELSFSRSKDIPSTYRPDRIEEQINAAWNRVRKVLFENRDYLEILDLYDGNGSFFYIDPPYHIRNRYASDLFEEKDFISLRDKCKSLKGKFLITLNDDSFVRETFKEFHMEPLGITYTSGRYRGAEKNIQEIIIANYDADMYAGMLPCLF